MTTVETQTETPDDLSAALNKTSDALEAITTQISDLQSEMRRRTARLDTLEVDTLEHSRSVAQLREQVQEAEEKLSRARIAANLARGGRAEKATAANVKTLTTDLAALQQELTDAQLKYSSQNTQSRVESESINKQLEEDQKTLEALQQTRSELKAEKQERKEALGQAIYVAIADEMRGVLETERKLEEALAEHRTKRLAQQESIALRLADWPELAQKLEEELMPVEKQEPEPSASVRMSNAFIKYLKLFDEYASHMEIPRESSRNRMVQIFSLNETLISLMLSQRGHAYVEGKLSEVRTYLYQVESQERERALYRELGLLNRSR